MVTPVPAPDTRVEQTRAVPTDDTRPSLGRRIWRILSGTPEPLRYEASAGAGTPPGEQWSRSGPDPAVPLLTVADLRARHFVSTKFRAGYDQDEVDDFLDLVVAELRRRHAAR